MIRLISHRQHVTALFVIALYYDWVENDREWARRFLEGALFVAHHPAPGDA